MVKIIELGTPPGDREYKARCTKCSTLFSFMRTEAEKVPDQRDGDALVIDCPVCQSKVWTAL